ncbi:hypothetical protein UFOVP816_24 [uncultured Caudovirales phage]|uniref:HTH_XRE domain containing protein n=1 Tax=uncultured Caudovirales phage TaxID=2100421 RepID=A0A6J5P5G3_9CAUD|nr:hypothetical protein UFOVP816_24 [uncultured Caudovirales phage]
MIPLRDWIWHQQQNNREFSEKKFASQLGISSPYFSAIKNNRVAMSMQLAFSIQEATNNAVQAIDLMKDNLATIPRMRGKRGRRSKVKNENNNDS